MAARLTADDRIAHPQRALLHEEARHHAATLVNRGIETDARRLAFGVGPQVVQFGDREQRVEELIDALASDRARLHDFRLTTPLGRQEFVGRQLLIDLLHVGAREVDLVDRHHDRHARRLGVADRLLGLRHQPVVGRDHEHGAVGDVGAAGPHLGERLVPRRIDERDRVGIPLD